MTRAGAVALLLVALGSGSAGCGRKPPTATPEGAVRELVDRMQSLQGSPADAQAAFALLSAETRDNLTQRAKRYSDASGKLIAPEAMIVPSRFALRFEPKRYTAQISGKIASVTVTGPLPTDRAELRCYLEDGQWHVDLRLPELPPVQVRPGLEPR